MYARKKKKKKASSPLAWLAIETRTCREVGGKNSLLLFQDLQIRPPPKKKLEQRYNEVKDKKPNCFQIEKNYSTRNILGKGRIGKKTTTQNKLPERFVFTICCVREMLP